MTSDDRSHPDKEELAAFGLGKLDDAAHERVEQHIAECEACCEFLKSLPNDDRVVSLLRDSDAPRIDEPTSAVVAPPGMPIGTRVRYFGDYELLEEIARGGMGLVYKARQVSLGRIVAVKMILSGEFASKEDKRRFEIEAQSAAELDHPNVVPVYEVGEFGGQHYFSMGFVEGTSLAAELADGPLTAAQSAEIVRQVAQAVHYAHGQGVIHRDLKPSNILLDASGTPRVTDFGLAKRINRDATLTTTGQILGTPSYMSPEQAMGATDRVRESADVYSLGAVLYALLCGRPPFQADNAIETMRQVVTQEPVAPRQLNPAVPRDLETICLKCLQKTRRARYETAQELAEDLQRFLENRPVKARRIGPTTRAWRWCRRNPAIASLIAVTITSLVVGVAFSTYYAIEAKNRAEEAELNEKIALKQTERADLNARKAEIRAEHGLLLAGDGQMLAGNTSKARGLYQQAWDLAKKLGRSELPATTGLLATYHAATPPILGHEIGETEHGLPAFQGHTEWITGADVSRNAQRAVSCSFDGTVRWWDLLTGRNTGIHRAHSGPVQCVSFLPDGRRVISGGNDGKLIVWDTELNRAVHTLVGHSGPVMCLAVSPDGSRVASGARPVVDGNIGVELNIWNLEKGSFLRSIPTTRSQRIMTLSISPDGKSVVQGGWVWPLHLNEIQTGRLLRTFKGHRNPVTGSAFSSNGRFLVTSARDKTARVWEVETGKSVRVLDGFPNAVSAIAISNDAQYIVTGSNDGLLHYWRMSDGKQINSLNAHASTIRTVRFVGDSSIVLSAGEDKAIRLFELDPDKETRTYAGNRGAVEEVSISRNGLLCLSGGYDRRLHLEDAETGLPIRTWRAHAQTITDVQIAANGKQALSTSNRGGKLKLWNLATGALVSEFLETAPHRCALVPAGKYAVSGSVEPHNRIKLWDLESSRELRTIGVHDGWISCVFTDFDGRFVFSTSGDSTIRKWNTSTGAEMDRRTLVGNVFITGAVARDSGQLLLGTGDGSLILWNHPEADADLKTIQAHGSAVDAVTLSRSGEVGISGGRDNLIKIWDVETFAEIRVLKAHSHRVTGLEFDGEGHRFASGSFDRTVRIWDLDRPIKYAKLRRKALTALNRLRRNAEDGDAWNSLGEWHAFRGFHRGAIACFQSARRFDAAVSPLVLARCYWQMAEYENAEREFEQAIERNEAPKYYLQMCLEAIRRSKATR